MDGRAAALWVVFLAVFSTYATADGGFTRAVGIYGQAAKDDGGTMLLKVDNDGDGSYDFYNADQGLYFNTTSRHVETYWPGGFYTYNLTAGDQNRTAADVPMNGTYSNVPWTFYTSNVTQPPASPSHAMLEGISINYDKLTWYEGGLGGSENENLSLKMASMAATYILDAGYLPMEDLYDSGGGLIDWEYRGRLILFGEEYYVRNIQGYTKIYAAKGEVIPNIDNLSYSGSYLGYSFRVSAVNRTGGNATGVVLDVRRPNNTVTQAQLTNEENADVDAIEIAAISAAESNTTIMAYDLGTSVLLEDGHDMEVGGDVSKYWRVALNTVPATDPAVDIPAYANATSGEVLANITVEYRHAVEMEPGRWLGFPTTYRLEFAGFRTGDYLGSECSGTGEGEVLIARDGLYRATISFTGDDGQRYNGVYIDQGPFSRGDMFALNGLVYEYDDSAEPINDSTTMRLTLIDLLNNGTATYDLDAIAQTANVSSFTMHKLAFEDAPHNDQDVQITIDATNSNDSDVYIGQGPSQYILYNGGEIYLVHAPDLTTPLTRDNINTQLDGTYLGLDQFVFDGSSGATPLQKFDTDDSYLQLSIFNENGTVDANADRRQNMDDRLIQARNADNEYTVIDFYDRPFNGSVNTYYSEGVWTSGNPLSLAAPWTQPGNDPDTDYAKLWDNPQDTAAMTPEGGTEAAIEWGGARDISSVRICQPRGLVYATVFIGTEKTRHFTAPLAFTADETVRDQVFVDGSALTVSNSTLSMTDRYLILDRGSLTFENSRLSFDFAAISPP
jgi:hypothetical protein